MCFSLPCTARDWTLVHLMGEEMLPFRVLTPATLQVSHIGFEGGLHEKDQEMRKIIANKMRSTFGPFHDKVVQPKQKLDSPKSHPKGFGGWGHPADHEHCMKLFDW